MSKKLNLLLAASLLSGYALSGCGLNPATLASALAPQGAPAMNNAVQAESILGINKEISKQVEETFKQKDLNKDGKITPDEFPVKSPDDFVKFRQLDSNGDGKITTNEMAPDFFARVKDIVRLKATASFLFDQLNTTKDGKLTKDEAAAAKVPGIAENYDHFRVAPWYSKKKLDYLRGSDFENLVAFVMLNPGKILQDQPAGPPAPPAGQPHPPAPPAGQLNQSVPPTGPTTPPPTK